MAAARKSKVKREPRVKKEVKVVEEAKQADEVVTSPEQAASEQSSQPSIESEIDNSESNGDTIVEPTQAPVVDSTPSQSTPNEDEQEKSDNTEKAATVPDERASIFSSSYAPAKPKKNLIWLFIITLLIVIALSAGALMYYDGTKGTIAKKETPTVEVATKPTTTPVPDELDLSAYTIEVLNASGTSGEAGRAKKSLEDNGFKVESVGNSSVKGEGAEIRANEDVSKEYLEKLEESLEKSYSPVVIDLLEKDGNTDVVITLFSSE